MSRKLTIVTLSLVFALVLVVGSCTPVSGPTPSPEYKVVSFRLETWGKKEYDCYAFGIYLRNHETLYLSWQVIRGSDICFEILTPLGRSLGFCDYEGSYANGTLEENACRPMTAATTQFSPADYGWEGGHYEMRVALCPSQPRTANVEVRYAIRRSPVQ